MKNKKSSFRKILNSQISRYHGRINRACYCMRLGAKSFLMGLGVFGFVIGTPGAALAANLPSGAQVISGDININQIGSNAMRIMQDSQAAIVNWQSFDIGQGAMVDIVQPNINSAMLSRVIGNNLSEIHGSLNSNGQLFLVNPNGILFGESAQINVYSLVASTLDIADTDFLSGNIHFTGDSEAAVINLGTINSESFSALIAGDVQNLGDILSPGGDAALLSGDAIIEVGDAAGGKITMDLSGLLNGSSSNAGTIDVSSPESTGGSVTVVGESVANSGIIEASGKSGGGEVLIGGDYLGANDALSNAKNAIFSGSVSANAIDSGEGGRVIVWSDERTEFSGEIQALGGNGFVETSSKMNLIANGSVTVPNGQWLLDPRNVTISSSSTSGGSFNSGDPDTFTPSSDDSVVQASAIVSALNAGTSVKITTGADGSQAGNIVVSSFIAPNLENGDVTLTLEAAGGVDINSMINASGTDKLNLAIDAGGAVTVDGFIHTNAGSFASEGTTFRNTSQITTRGGAIDLSNHTGTITLDSSVSTVPDSGTGASFTSGGTDLTVNSTLSTGGASIAINNTGDIVVNANIDSSGDTAGTFTVSDAANSVNVVANITTGGNMNFGNNPVTVSGAGRTLTNSGTQSITFGNSLDGDSAAGDDAITVNSGSGGVTFSNNVGSTDPLESLTIDSDGSVDFDGTAVVAGNIDIDSTTASFDNTVSTTAGGTFTLTNSGTATFVGAADLSLDGAFHQDGTGGVTTSGDITTSGDGITFDGALSLSGDVSLDTTSGSASGANITLNSTTTGAAALTANSGTGGTATFVGAVGTNLTSLTVDASATNFDSTLEVAGNIDIDTTTGSFDNTVTTTNNGTVTITNSGGLTIASAADFSLDGLLNQDGSGAVSLSSDVTTSGDAVTFSGAVTLGDAVAIDTTNGGGSASGADVTFSSSLDGGTTFTVDAGSAGDLVVTGAVGVTTPLTSITVSEATDVTLSAALNLTGVLDTTGTGTTTLTGAASAASFDVSATTAIVSSSTLTATGGGNIILASDELDFNGGANSIIGTGTLTLKQATAAATIGIGSDAGQTLDLTDSDIAALKDGFSSISIGDASSGNVVVDGASFLDSITIISGGDLTVQTAALSTSDGAISLSADGAVTINHSVDATTTVAITADVDGSGDEDITINAGDTGSSTIAGTTVTLSSGGTATDVVHTDNFDNAEGGITYNDSLSTLVFNSNGGIDAEGAINTGDNAITINANASFDTDQADDEGANNLTIGGTVTLGSSTLTLDAGTGTIALYSATAADASGGKITIADADLLQLTGGDVIIDGEIDDDGGEFLDELTAGNTIQVTGNGATLQTRNDVIDLTGFNIIGDADDDSLTINSNNAAITLASVGQGGGDNDIGAFTVDAGDSSNAISLTADITAEGNVQFTNTSELDIAAGVDITATGTSDILANTGVTAIDFSDGTAGTNVFTAGQDITFGASLTDSGAGPATITLAPSRNLTLAGANLGGGSNPTLDINIGTSGVGTLTFGTASVSAGSIDIDGAGDDDTIEIDQDLTASVGAWISLV